MRTRFRLRLHFISGALLLFALLLVGRLYSLQIVYGEEFSDRADHQYVAPSTGLYDRGSVFFEDKEGRRISAATLKSGFTVYLNPRILERATTTYAALSLIIPLDEEMFLARASKEGDPYEEIGKRVPELLAKQVDELGIEGVGIRKERWRYYPGEELAAHTLGFVGYSEDEFSGRYGLERYYEQTLSREQDGLYVNFFAEIFANVGESIKTGELQRSGNLVTSIEPSVERALEDKIKAVQNRYQSRLSGGIIMNPKTGEIYAMAVYPAFNPNAVEEAENNLVFGNPLIEDVYEMGSIIKALTMAAALDSGAVTRKTTYNDKGTLSLNGKVISNYDGKGRGVVSMQEVLNQSLNTGAAFAALKTGTEAFRSYMLSFGLGEETGIDLPNEVAGLVDNLDSPRELEYATASFGQGIAVTPIETVRALSALGNGGKLVTPHVVTEIEYESGLTKTLSYPPDKQVLNPGTSEEITRMLVEVTDTALLGGALKLPNYSIAAKTGTAQIANPSGGGYYEDKFLHSFFGYFPAYEPQFLVFLYTVEPKGVPFASQTLARPFMDIAQFLINYYEIPPDR